MTKRTSLFQYLDVIVIFLLGLFFIIFPSFMIEWIGLILCGYLLLKALLCFLIPIIGTYQGILYLVLSLLSFIFWKFLITFIVVLLGVILVIAGLNKLLSLYSKSHNIKAWLLSFIVCLLEICGGVAIIITSLSNADNILGYIIGAILIIVAISKLISQIHIQKKDSPYEQVTHDKHKNEDAIDAEIVSENTTDAE